MSFKMVATDFDDTLVPIGELLSGRNRRALDRVRAQGVTVAIVSGRTTYGLLTQLRRNRVDTEGLYLVGYNGAQAVQAWDQAPLFSHKLGLDLARQAADVASEFDVAVMVPEGPYVYTNRPDDFSVVFEAESNGTEIVLLDDVAQLPFAPHKLLIGAKPPELQRVHQALRTQFASQGEAVISAGFLMEFTAKGVHKGEALSGLCRALSVPADDVVVFGDNHNDAHMFGLGGLSVAVGNAVPELLALADRITATCADDGVADILEEIFEERPSAK